MDTTENGVGAKRSVPFAAVRRKIIVLGILLFLIGFVAGALFGIYGFRQIMFMYRPSMEEISARRAAAVQRDFGLSDEIRDGIVEENRKHFFIIRDTFDAVHSKVEESEREYAENVAKLLDDPAKKKRWLETYMNYFPRRPPPPDPRHPPPPPR